MVSTCQKQDRGLGCQAQGSSARGWQSQRLHPQTGLHLTAASVKSSTISKGGDRTGSGLERGLGSFTGRQDPAGQQPGWSLHRRPGPSIQHRLQGAALGRGGRPGVRRQVGFKVTVLVWPT